MIEYQNIEPDKARELILAKLNELFPVKGWELLDAMDEYDRKLFYAELAEKLMANLEFIRRGQESKHVPKPLVHNERLIFVGRHADWLPLEEHDAVYILDDAVERLDLQKGFAEALKYVTKTLILQGLNEKRNDWQVPVMVNVPYDRHEHRDARMIYACYLVKSLQEAQMSVLDNIRTWIMSELQREMQEVPSAVNDQLKTLKDRVFYAPSVFFSTRAFEPFAI